MELKNIYNDAMTPQETAQTLQTGARKIKGVQPL